MFTRWLECRWTLYLLTILFSIKWFYSSWAVCTLTLLLEYFNWMYYQGDCSIRIPLWCIFHFITHWNSFLHVVHHHSNFQLFLPLIEAGTHDFLLHKNRSRNSVSPKSIVKFFPRLGLTSYLCCILLYSFLTTKRHPSDAESSYKPIFRLI